jgi:adenylyltransferase/sulfurtransferase
MTFRQLKLHKDPNCPICGENASIKELIDYEEFCGLKTTQVEPLANEEITAPDLKALFDSGVDFQLIDVREPFEYEIARIPTATLIPLGEVVKRASEIDVNRTVVVHCKGGVRSAKAIDALKAAGYAGRLINLKGGIGAWSAEVDNSVPRY